MESHDHTSNIAPLPSLPKAMNVLVFNNGRTVKLADFGSAMHIEDIPALGTASLKGCSPHFAAPEVSWSILALCFMDRA